MQEIVIEFKGQDTFNLHGNMKYYVLFLQEL